MDAISKHAIAREAYSSPGMGARSVGFVTFEPQVLQPGRWRKGAACCEVRPEVGALGFYVAVPEAIVEGSTEFLVHRRLSKTSSTVPTTMLQPESTSSMPVTPCAVWKWPSTAVM